MESRSELSKEAYRYISDVPGSLTITVDEENWKRFIPLEELRLMQEGIADPSPSLAGLWKEMPGNTFGENVIEVHLVGSFQLEKTK